MKRIDRFNLVDKIGRELQARMTYADISSYLTGFGIDCDKDTSGVNSKWVWTKVLLTDAPDETIFDIADELNIEHGFSSPQKIDLTGSKFWLASHFRLFLSHIASIKDKTAKLQKALREYGVSAFVAHEDIEPTKEWQDEIEKALFSMDALVTILTPGFTESKWTDQEVGVAIGRDVLIVPIRKGLDPYGFIAKYQGLQGTGKSIAEVADAIFEIIANHNKTKGAMAEALVNQILFAKKSIDAEKKLTLLSRIKELPIRHLEKLQENIQDTLLFSDSENFLTKLNKLFKDHGMHEVTLKTSDDTFVDNVIPF